MSTDAEQHYSAHTNEIIANRYKIKQKLGFGTFGTVYSAVDQETHRFVAIKFIRSLPKYIASGRRELEFINIV